VAGVFGNRLSSADTSSGVSTTRAGGQGARGFRADLGARGHCGFAQSRGRAARLLPKVAGQVADPDGVRVSAYGLQGPLDSRGDSRGQK